MFDPPSFSIWRDTNFHLADGGVIKIRMADSAFFTLHLVFFMLTQVHIFILGLVEFQFSAGLKIHRYSKKT